jgi:hypothetical protein
MDRETSSNFVFPNRGEMDREAGGITSPHQGEVMK